MADLISAVPRVDVEVLQSALFGVQTGGATTRALRRINRKRLRGEEEAERSRRRRLDTLVQRMADRALEVAMRRRELEDEARRDEREATPTEEEGDANYAPQDTGAGAGDDNDFNFRMVPRPEGLNPDWGLLGN